MLITDNNMNDTFQIFRFGEKQYIEQFARGHFNFSCAGAYINQATRDNNNEQGDKYEAVFARLKPNDKRIKEMKKALGDDLEIVEDGKYLLLRRYSARLVPMFCFFNYKIKDLQDATLDEESNGVIPLALKFDEKMYSGFDTHSCDPVHKLSLVTVDTAEFIEKIDNVIHSEFGKLANMKSVYVDYDYRKGEEFFIKPTDDYCELKYKRPRYSYQHEGRIILPGCKFYSEQDRLDLVTTPFLFDCHITDELPIIMKYYCRVSDISGL